MPLEFKIVITCDRCHKASIETTFSPYSSPHKNVAKKKAVEHGWLCESYTAMAIKDQRYYCPECKDELYEEETAHAQTEEEWHNEMMGEIQRHGGGG